MKKSKKRATKYEKKVSIPSTVSFDDLMRMAVKTPEIPKKIEIKKK